MRERKKQERIFFKVLYGNKKKKLLFLIVSMIVLFAMYFKLENQLKENREIEIQEDDFSWVCQVDSIEEVDGTIILSGFSFLLGQDAEEMFELILYDIETGKRYYPKMQYSNREDVNDYFLCGYDYTKSGFIAKILAQKLDIENSVYEVLLRPIGNKKAYALGIYYTNGKMYFTNPKEFEALDVIGTDLERIVEDGVLRVYQPDYGMYVYQYERELYWIAEEWYGFNVNHDTYVEFQMNTTQIHNLPKDRLANNWFWSNLGFSFQSKELIDWNTGKYRVTRCTLPTEYSITKIWTGNYSNEWIWKRDFRPWYEFREE